VNTNAAVRPQIGDMCGSPAITVGRATTTYGFPATGIVHLKDTGIGFPTGGFTAETIGRCRKGTGGKPRLRAFSLFL
jgi:hypothetical protein